MRRSMTALCLDDHGNDPKVLNAWLGNKQPHVYRALLAALEQRAIDRGNSRCTLSSTATAGTRFRPQTRNF